MIKNKSNDSKGFMLYLIISLLIIICALVFIIGKVWFKKQVNEKKEDSIHNIVIDGVWKAKYMEIDTDKFGKEYYVVFNKDGKVYAIDEDGVKEGNYFDTNSDDATSFSLQINDETISLCKYEHDNIQCDLYNFIEKVNIKREN